MAEAVIVKQEAGYVSKIKTDPIIEQNVKVKEEFEFVGNTVNDGEALSTYVTTSTDRVESIKSEVKSETFNSEPLNREAAQKIIKRDDNEYNGNDCGVINTIFIKSESLGDQFPADINIEIKNEDETFITSEFIVKDDYDGQSKAESVSSNETLIQSKSPKGGFKCEVCNKQFRYKSVFQSHWLIHFEKKPFECSLCHKLFKRKSNLRKHVVVHSDEKQFKCNLCLTQFRLKGTLQRHMLIHSEEKPFKCDICLKQFRLRGNLRRHMLTHSEEKQFKCDICQKQFHQNLWRHMLIHSEEKPFECYVCKKSFKRKSDLQEHVSVHSEERPFKCDLCPKQFRAKRDARRHTLTHSDKK